jgi:hypothetical protein
MSMFHIGAGGWAYFNMPGMDSLNAYSKSMSLQFSTCSEGEKVKY